MLGMDITACNCPQQPEMPQHLLLNGVTTGTYKPQWVSKPLVMHTPGGSMTSTIDMPRKTRIVDDTILWDSNLESAFWHTLDYIQHCASNGIIFNPGKFVFSQDDVEFGGFTLTSDGIKPTSSMIKAITDFPAPTDITGMRSWFGLVSQVAYLFCPSRNNGPIP